MLRSEDRGLSVQGTGDDVFKKRLGLRGLPLNAAPLAAPGVRYSR